MASVQKDGWQLHDAAVDTMQQQQYERSDAQWKAQNRAGVLAREASDHTAQTPSWGAAQASKGSPPEQK